MRRRLLIAAIFLLDGAPARIRWQRTVALVARTLLSLPLLLPVWSCASHSPPIYLDKAKYEMAATRLQNPDSGQEAASIAGIRGAGKDIYVDLWLQNFPENSAASIGLRVSASPSTYLELRSLDGSPIRLCPSVRPFVWAPGVMIDFAPPETVRIADRILIQACEVRTAKALRAGMYAARLSEKWHEDPLLKTFVYVDHKWVHVGFNIDQAPERSE